MQQKTHQPAQIDPAIQPLAWACRKIKTAATHYMPGLRGCHGDHYHNDSTATSLSGQISQVSQPEAKDM